VRKVRSRGCRKLWKVAPGLFLDVANWGYTRLRANCNFCSASWRQPQLYIRADILTNSSRLPPSAYKHRTVTESSGVPVSGRQCSPHHLCYTVTVQAPINRMSSVLCGQTRRRDGDPQSHVLCGLRASVGFCNIAEPVNSYSSSLAVYTRACGRLPDYWSGVSCQGHTHERIIVVCY
jgi:hypothetical protein